MTNQLNNQESKLEKPFFDSIIQTFIDIIEKLDFSIKEENEDRDDDEDDFMEESQANTAKDYTLMANLVQLATNFLKWQKNPKLFQPWIEPLGFCIISYSTKRASQERRFGGSKRLHQYGEITKARSKRRADALAHQYGRTDQADAGQIAKEIQLIRRSSVF